MSLRRPK